MKLLSAAFALSAVLLSDVMCAVVAYNYCSLSLGGIYGLCSAPAGTAFVLAIPYLVGIVLCVVLTWLFWRKSKA